MGDHLSGIVVKAVGHPGRGDAIAVGQTVGQGDAVLGPRQVLRGHRQAGRMPEHLAKTRMVLRAPGHSGQVAADGGAHRAVRADQLHLVAPHEVPGRVGFVEMLRQDRNREGTGPAVHRFGKPPRDHPGGMVHQASAYQVGIVRQPVGEPPRYRQQHQPRRAKPVGGERDNRRAGALHRSGTVIPGHAGRPALRIRLDLEHPCAGDQLRPRGDGLRPVADVGGAARAVRTAQIAGTAVVAGPAPHAMAFGVDRHIGRPPVPAQSVEGARHPLARLARRHRRHAARRAGRIARVPGQAGDAHHAVVLLVIGGDVLVADRPVVADAVQRPCPEIRWPEARKMRAPEDRRAADGIVEKGLDRRVGVVDRVILRRGADVRVGVMGGLPGDFPVGTQRRRGVRIDPAALFEAGHPDARAGQPPCRRGTAGPCPDDHHIGHGAASAGDEISPRTTRSQRTARPCPRSVSIWGLARQTSVTWGQRLAR